MSNAIKVNLVDGVSALFNNQHEAEVGNRTSEVKELYIFKNAIVMATFQKESIHLMLNGSRDEFQSGWLAIDFPQDSMGEYHRIKREILDEI